MNLLAAIDGLPPTSNLDMVGPDRLTREEFLGLPVSPEVLAARGLIQRLEDVLRFAPEGAAIHEDTLVPVHRHAAGLYMRELTMPAGSVIVGKRHAQSHGVIITRGECVVVTERGQEVLKAPCTFVSPAGEKRALFVIEETTWITVHATQAKNMADIEADLILPGTSLQEI